VSENQVLCQYVDVVLCRETNLKVRQALPCTADMMEIEQLSRFDGQYHVTYVLVCGSSCSDVCISQCLKDAVNAFCY